MLATLGGILALIVGLALLLLPVTVSELSRPRDSAWGAVVLLLGLVLVTSAERLTGAPMLAVLCGGLLIGRLGTEVGQARWRQLSSEEQTALRSSARWRTSLNQLLTVSAQLLAGLITALVTVRHALQQTIAQRRQPRGSGKRWIRQDDSTTIPDSTDPAESPAPMAETATAAMDEAIGTEGTAIDAPADALPDGRGEAGASAMAPGMTQDADQGSGEAIHAAVDDASLDEAVEAAADAPSAWLSEDAATVTVDPEAVGAEADSADLVTADPETADPQTTDPQSPDQEAAATDPTAVEAAADTSPGCEPTHATLQAGASNPAASNGPEPGTAADETSATAEGIEAAPTSEANGSELEGTEADPAGSPDGAGPDAVFEPDSAEAAAEPATGAGPAPLPATPAPGFSADAESLDISDPLEVIQSFEEIDALLDRPARRPSGAGPIVDVEVEELEPG